MDRIAFDLVPATFHDAPAVEITLNGRRLVDILDAHGVRSVPLAAADALWPGHVIWAGDPPQDATLIEDGRVAVTTCTCGVFGCGGVTAEIALSHRRVVWRRFREAFGDELPLSAYTFDSARYHQALRGIADEYRRGHPPSGAT